MNDRLLPLLGLHNCCYLWIWDSCRVWYRMCYYVNLLCA